MSLTRRIANNPSPTSFKQSCLNKQDILTGCTVPFDGLPGRIVGTDAEDRPWRESLPGQYIHSKSNLTWRSTPNALDGKVGLIVAV